MLIIDRLVLDVRYALRRMRHEPRSTAVVVATIGLAVGLATVVYSVASSVLLRPLPYRDPARLVMIFRTIGDVNIIPPPTPELFALRARSRTLESLAGLERDGYTVVTRDATEWADAFAVSANLFSVLGVQPMVGRTFLPQDDQPGYERVVVLTEDFWRRVFGADPNVVGRRVRLSGPDRPAGQADSYEVIGVVPASVRLFSRLPLRADIYVPRVIGPKDLAPEAWMAPGQIVFGRLAPGATVAQADAEVRAILKAAAAEHRSLPNAGSRVTSLHEELVGQTRPAFLLLSAAALVLLVIGCVNVASLLVAAGLRRTRELAVRLAIGCSRARLWQQLIVEHLLLALLGGSVGTLLAVWVVPAVGRLAPASLPRVEHIRLEPTALLFALATSLAAGLLFGAAPAWLLLRRRPGGLAIAGAGTLAPATRRLRAGFVVVTTTLALILLASAGLVANGLWRLARLDLRFDPAGVSAFTIDLPERWWEHDRSLLFERDLAARVRALPGVEMASATSDVPFAWGALVGNVHLADGRPGPHCEVVEGDADYLRLLRIPLRAGRLLGPGDAASRRVAVVNETLQRHLGPGSAVGRRLQLGDHWREVVGVVADVTEVGQLQGGVIKRDGLARMSNPAAYIPSATFGDQPSFRLLLVRSSLPLPQLTKAVSGQLRAIDPELTVRRSGALSERIRNAGADVRFYGAIIAAFALVALALSSVGLYGLLAHSVSQRAREIGVRVALGATPRRIRALVVGEALALLAAGCVLGLVLAAAGGRAMRSLLFEVAPADPLTLTAAVAVLSLVGGLAACGPVRRALAVDVASVLKSE